MKKQLKRPDALNQLILKYYPTKKFNIILDVGAKGDTTLNYWESLSPSKIYSFEPDECSCSELVKRVKNNHQIEVIQKAVGLENKKDQPFYIHRKNRSANTLKPSESTDVWTSTSVDVIRLDTFLKEKNIVKVDLIDSDTQGYDYEVLSGAGEYLKTVDIICVEVWFSPPELRGSYKGVQTFEKIMTLMKNNGLELFDFKCLTYVHNQLSWGEAIFYRHPNE